MKTEFYSSEMLSEYLSDMRSYSSQQIKIVESYINDNNMLYVQYQINTDTENWKEEVLVNSFELINWIYDKLIK